MEKVIDIWVCYLHNINWEADSQHSFLTKDPNNPSAYSKAKLVIELPERKKEFSETEFDKIVQLYDYEAKGIKSYADFIKLMRGKIFND